jgi:hypothetical protein
MNDIVCNGYVGYVCGIRFVLFHWKSKVNVECESLCYAVFFKQVILFL